jgi:ATP phosphoribosyltransferase regulatory subunit
VLARPDELAVERPAERGRALPRGARDLLPAETRRRRAVVERLLHHLDGWGYAPIQTPAVEFFDVFARGLSGEDRRRCVRFIDPGSGEVMALRSDVTPQVARLVGGRLGGVLDADRVRRLAYVADLVVQPDGPVGRSELHQVGVELVGDGSIAADAELIALAHASLAALGLSQVRLDLSHAGFARAVLGLVEDHPRVGPEVLGAVTQALAHKDAGTVVAALRGAGVDRALADGVAALCDLYGPPDVIARARAVLPAEAAASLDRLDALVGALRELDPAAAQALFVDLGQIRGTTYYTGYRLRAWAPGATEPVARGGRYNDLLGRYGSPRPATGFAIDLDALDDALLAAGVEVEGSRPNPGHLIVVPAGADGGTRLRAAHVAAAARGTGHRAWVEVGLDEARAQQVAAAEGCERLTWFDGAGAVQRLHLRDAAWIAITSGHSPDPTEQA